MNLEKNCFNYTHFICLSENLLTIQPFAKCYPLNQVTNKRFAIKPDRPGRINHILKQRSESIQCCWITMKRAGILRSATNQSETCLKWWQFPSDSFSPWQVFSKHVGQLFSFYISLAGWDFSITGGRGTPEFNTFPSNTIFSS